MLGSHPDFCAPHSPHIVKVFVPLLPNYGPLTETSNLKSLAADMVHVVSIQLRGWPHLPTADEVVENCTEQSFAGLVNSLYDLAAKEEGKSRSFIKDNGNMQHAADISLLFPDATFVYLVRDARDVALSWKKSPGHPGGVKEAARMWRTEQAYTLQFLGMCPDPSRIAVVHYEDLISSPDPELRRICNVVGVSYDDAMLEFHKGSEAKTSADAAIGWKNLTSPVMKDNRGKYLKELSVGEQKAIERIAGRQMLQLGYKPGQVHDLGAAQSGTLAKLFRAGRAAIPQLLRGPAGVQELKKRAKRLAGMREIMIRAGKHNPEWHRAGMHSQDDTGADNTGGQSES
jgi:hypothetical protein